ncbi:hypothetical protein PUR49_08085 [Streptomyces sp. BE147]|uniref:hypothetical protein n=1 Tax=Streptomyces sp. BE147 TaxID=3002524 RepID=UPI002E79A1ED|nr:hypothetical protein [Streptomyces sp. BE147]MEE1736457.1 hypothetical protein [Streptomyces sp. BE147]
MPVLEQGSQRLRCAAEGGEEAELSGGAAVVDAGLLVGVVVELVVGVPEVRTVAVAVDLVRGGVAARVVGKVVQVVFGEAELAGDLVDLRVGEMRGRQALSGRGGRGDTGEPGVAQGGGPPRAGAVLGGEVVFGCLGGVEDARRVPRPGPGNVSARRGRP